jgi:NADH-quinone oxidoreductase subunit C
MSIVTTERLAALAEQIIAKAGGAVTGSTIAFGELNIEARADQIVPLLTLLKEGADFQFQQLIELCGVDYPERPLRFDVVYLLLSLTNNLRLRVKVQTDEDTAVPSVTGVYPNADWCEREAFDMYGMLFSGHPDLRRLLTDYGFQGHPLRKDFPMTGYVEVRYDEEQKRVVYEPVKLTQEFRNFDFLSPWEGAEYPATILPGDEKAG